MSDIFIGWSNKEEMIKDFEMDEKQIKELEEYEVLMAAYENGGYDGSACVLLRKGEEMFLVRGSHCSCYGLEGQWGIEKTSPEAILKETYGTCLDLQHEIAKNWGKK